ncbi:MAG: hypothetical protein IAE92_11805 [Burkholderiaceae bacterium]|nr:hypothetical protein [Burkholderiaceae bacterium]
MQVLWCHEDPEEFARWARKLHPGASPITQDVGETEEAEPGLVRSASKFYFRASPSLHVCALCVDKRAEQKTSRRDATPVAVLLYIHPASSDPQTLVQWLMADYRAAHPDGLGKDGDTAPHWHCSFREKPAPGQLREALVARALWQPDLFSRARRGPMRALWRDDNPEEFDRWARKLQRPARLILRGNGESNGPIAGDWSLGFYFRRSPSLHVCALCVQDEATADWEPPARRAAPAPTLLYIFPTSNDPQTLVRWLVADYCASGQRWVDEIDEQGDFELDGVVDAWDQPTRY